VPLTRVAEPGEISAAVPYLCSSASSSVVGAEIVIDGGMTLRFAGFSLCYRAGSSDTCRAPTPRGARRGFTASSRSWGIEISQATVSKYVVRDRKPPSQTWRTFLTAWFAKVLSRAICLSVATAGLWSRMMVHDPA
jgi:Enoyl-(Acyl carrier protein) reductase